MSDSNDIYTLPLLPLRGVTLFPGMPLGFDVGRQKSKNAVEKAMYDKQLIFVSAQKDITVEEPKKDDVYKVGTVAKIQQLLKMPGDNVRVMVEGLNRAVLHGFSDNGNFIEASVQNISESDSKHNSPAILALMRKAKKLFQEYCSILSHIPGEIFASVYACQEPGKLSDAIAQNLLSDYSDKQTVLDELNHTKRLRKLISILSHEIEVSRLEIGINDKLCEQMDKSQREYILREQIKIIQDELGDTENLLSEAAEYKEKIKKLSIPDEYKTKLMKECDRLSSMPYQSPENAISRNYLDYCISLPWDNVTEEQTDIKKAEKILNDEHFGLDKVKERVLEFLAVDRLITKSNSQILCLVGPPGTGKTSIASSIAHASGRKLSRISLGGVRDEADIRGHRKTYVGAMPGRIISAIEQAGSKNCIILLDEIDKLGHDFHGDPAAALLEVLDSEQNHSFRDHYLEIPFDLSKIIFITTANNYDGIPQPLLDRMEIINIEGYTDEEKLIIAKKHLIPKNIDKHGLKKQMLKISDAAIRRIIEKYTREAGVRSLERQIAKICRKFARQFIEGSLEALKISEKNLAEYLGTPKYKREQLSKKSEVGVVNGLAWTSVGGEILEVEAGVVNGTGKLELTGNLGDVMKESAKAALTYIRSRAEAFGISDDFYKSKDMHIHFPEGAVPKDGPSAGITTATAIISALTSKPVRKDIAMTGEITLRGRVLPIGGLKEKTMAAYRAGIHSVIIPEDNVPDLDEIDPVVRKGLKFIPVSHMDAVVKEAITGKN